MKTINLTKLRGSSKRKTTNKKLHEADKKALLELEKKLGIK